MMLLLYWQYKICDILIQNALNIFHLFFNFEPTIY